MFDRFTLAHHRVSHGRHLLIFVSVLCHGLVLAGLVIYSFFHVKELPAPNLALTFLRVAPIPVMLGLGPQTQSHPKQRPTKRSQPNDPLRPRLHATTPAPPVDTPPQPPTEQSSGTEGNGEPGDESGGDPSGVPGGAPTGEPGGVGTGEPPLGQTERPVRNIAHELDPSQILYRPEPHLPDPVKARYLSSGEVLFIAKVCIDREGRVFRTDVIQGIEGASDPILETIRTWRYRPQPLPVCFLARWIFTINR